MKELTVRQRQVLDLINQKIEKTGLPPTRAEISQEFGFKSPNAAEEHLRALAKKGAIHIMPGTSRGLRLPENLLKKSTPIISITSMSNTIVCEENIEGYCDIPTITFYPKMDYFLRVKDLSLKNAGILKGDLLAVHTTQNVGNGQIAVVRVSNHVFVHRFKKENNKIYLTPENDDFSRIVLDIHTDLFAIEGIGVGVVRSSSL